MRLVFAGLQGRAAGGGVGKEIACWDMGDVFGVAQALVHAYANASAPCCCDR